ncbi:MAG: rhomboid family intramembrane serine protease [Longimicrobiales bacterium]|nr:rhomboid family intramembrane serine protease [Longimicrobiales bacterium]
MVKRLLVVNAVVFAITLIWPPALELLALHPPRLLTRPWGVLTYIFVHGGFWHLAINMLMLFFFGTPLEGRWGSREFLRFYLVSGLGGAILSILFMPASVVGASGATYGVMLAFAMNWPNAPIHVYGIFPVKAKWLVGFLFVVSLLEGLSGSGNGIAHFAHLGGIVAAFLYLKADWRPAALVGRTPGSPIPRHEKTGGGKVTVSARKEKTPRQRRSKTRQIDDTEERRILDEVDRVLDKISERGIASLTAAERELLDEVSRRRRSN